MATAITDSRTEAAYMISSRAPPVPWLFFAPEAHAVMYSLLATARSKTCANSGELRESFFGAGCPAAGAAGAGAPAGAGAAAVSDIC